MVLRPKNKAQQVDPGVGAPYPGEKRVNFITVVDFPLSFSFLPFFRFASFSAASSADGVPKKEKKRKEERKKESVEGRRSKYRRLPWLGCQNGRNYSHLSAGPKKLPRKSPGEPMGPSTSCIT